MRGNREQGVGSSVQKLKQLAAFGAMTATLILAGCRQDMQDQPKFFPQRGTTLYPDGRSVRPQVENTVAANANGTLSENRLRSEQGDPAAKEWVELFTTLADQLSLKVA